MGCLRGKQDKLDLPYACTRLAPKRLTAYGFRHHSCASNWSKNSVHRSINSMRIRQLSLQAITQNVRDITSNTVDSLFRFYCCTTPATRLKNPTRYFQTR